MIRKLALAATAALALAAIASPAIARDRVFTAQLQTPVAERTQVVANGGVWTCVESTCRGTVQAAATIVGCRQLSREVGVLLSYGSETRPLTQERLAQCNEAAAAPTTATAAN